MDKCYYLHTKTLLILKLFPPCHYLTGPIMTFPLPDRTLDTTGLSCPQPLLKLSVLSPDIKQGETVLVVGDCPTFEKDIRAWCSRLKKTLLLVRDDGGYQKSIYIRF